MTYTRHPHQHGLPMPTHIASSYVAVVQSYLYLQEVLGHAVDLLEALRVRLSARTRESCGQSELRPRARVAARTILLCSVLLGLLLRGSFDGARVDALHPDEFTNSCARCTGLKGVFGERRGRGLRVCLHNEVFVVVAVVKREQTCGALRSTLPHLTSCSSKSRGTDRGLAWGFIHSHAKSFRSKCD